jgi:hypothetical protein
VVSEVEARAEAAAAVVVTLAAAAAAACMAAERLGGTECCNGAGMGLLLVGVKDDATCEVAGACDREGAEAAEAVELSEVAVRATELVVVGDREGGGEVGD